MIKLDKILGLLRPKIVTKIYINNKKVNKLPKEYKEKLEKADKVFDEMDHMFEHMDKMFRNLFD